MDLQNRGPLLLLLGISALAGAAEPDEIVTDRPDFVESGNVVGKGRFQIETSIAQERDKGGGFKDKTWSTPTLLRFGVGDTLELRIETDGRMRATTDNLGAGARVTESGYADVALGVKWHIADENGWRPSLGILAHADLDTGSAPFRAAGKGGSLRLAAEWELPDEFSLGVMPGLATQRGDDGGRYTSAIFGVVLGKGWTDRFRTFVEYSAPQIARARNGGSITTFDVGCAYLVADNMQVDAAVSRALNKNTPDWSWTVGFSIKF